MRKCDVSELVGKTLVRVKGMNVGSERIKFICSDGSEYHMYHEQYCCETVTVDDVVGEASDILDVPVSMAECASNHASRGEYDSATWTFYRIAANGYVTIKWLGESNGYYSEEVDFACVNEATT